MLGIKITNTLNLRKWSTRPTAEVIQKAQRKASESQSVMPHNSNNFGIFKTQEGWEVIPKRQPKAKTPFGLYKT